MAQRYDFTKRVHKPYILPKGASMCEDDMETEIACAACGEGLKFGDSYTSMRIHGDFGLGYMVCSKCYIVELQAMGIARKTEGK